MMENTMSQAENLNITKLSRRTALAGISAAVAPAIAAVDKSLGAVTLPVDPIIALIADHRAAVEVYVRANDAYAWLHVNDPEYKEAQNASSEAGHHAYDLLWEILHVQPATLAGVAALLAHVGQLEFIKEEPDEDERETHLSTCNAFCDLEFKRAAQDFPVRLAETVRRLIAAA
jgi:hypothetical protein